MKTGPSASRRVLAALVFLVVSTEAAAQARTLSFEQRVDAQRAIERVYWSHRIWPKENPGPKPSFAAVMPDTVLQAKVTDALAKSAALARYWRRPLRAEQLQAEIDRMARDTRDPKLLQDLFDALGNDPYVIAETLGRQALADRLIRSWHADDTRTGEPGARGTSGRVAAGASPLDVSFDGWWRSARPMLTVAPSEEAQNAPVASFRLPVIAPGGCTNDTWAPTHQEYPDPRVAHTVVWTGTEMIVWGGGVEYPETNTGGRYNPATDTWSVTSRGPGVPKGRESHTAVWTGTEMIVWGGYDFDGTTHAFNTGGRYDPTTDQWQPTSTGAGTPTARLNHTAVWTGTEMIVWGGTIAGGVTNTGGRYDPVADTWTPTSTAPGVPAARALHAAVWTGSLMIVWGGSGAPNTGARYDPATDQWTPAATANAPDKAYHAAVWTGSEMIVWGGSSGSSPTSAGGRYDPVADHWTPTSLTNAPLPRSNYSVIWTGTEVIVWGGYRIEQSQVVHLNDGGRYDPVHDHWTPTSTGAGVPDRRESHTAVWTGDEMIVWGGWNDVFVPFAGGRYDPSTDTWVATSTGTSAPPARFAHTAVWTGAEMIVWGGRWDPLLNTGARYEPATDSWTPTSTGPDVPLARAGHGAVWTGREMIVWGGTVSNLTGSSITNSGGRYDPALDQWRPTSTGANVPAARGSFTTLWTGREMIVWGGSTSMGISQATNTGGRYDPSTDQWAPTGTGAGVPAARYSPTSVWTGTEMIVWGGSVWTGSMSQPLSTGGRYRPGDDTWSPTSTGANAPSARAGNSAVWTGHEMIVWGGISGQSVMATGGRYDPTTDHWLPTSTGAGIPSARYAHAASWTGEEMIVWSGSTQFANVKLVTGARYRPSTDTWTAMGAGVGTPPGRSRAGVAWTGREMIVWGGDAPTSSGGLYCACPGGAIVYRDADGDGFGDAGVPSSSCDGTVPSGYVSNGDDCDDADASSWGVPGEVANLLLQPADTGGANLSWSAASGGAPGTLVYDVMRANGPSGFVSAACIASDSSGTQASDAAVPAAGSAFFYLVRAQNTCGAGVAGTSANGSPVSARSCP